MPFDAEHSRSSGPSATAVLMRRPCTHTERDCHSATRFQPLAPFDEHDRLSGWDHHHFGSRGADDRAWSASRGYQGGLNRNDSQQARWLAPVIPRWARKSESGRAVLGDRNYDATAIRWGLRTPHIVPRPALHRATNGSWLRWWRWAWHAGYVAQTGCAACAAA